jgi:hypothetical protein
VWAAGAGWLPRGRAGRSTSSSDGSSVAGGWRVRTKHDDLQLLEIVRPKAPDRNLPNHYVTEGQEDAAFGVARQPAYFTHPLSDGLTPSRERGSEFLHPSGEKRAFNG